MQIYTAYYNYIKAKRMNIFKRFFGWLLNQEQEIPIIFEHKKQRVQQNLNVCEERKEEYIQENLNLQDTGAQIAPAMLPISTEITEEEKILESEWNILMIHAKIFKKQNPNIRLGQAIFIELAQKHALLADRISSSEVDPFYNDKNIPLLERCIVRSDPKEQNFYDRFQFGSYRGKVIQDVLEEHPSYIITMHERGHITFHKDVISAARKRVKDLMF